MPVPTGMATHAAVRAAGGRIKGPQAAILIGLVAAAGLILLAGQRRSGGGVKVPAAQSADVPAFTPPPGAPVLGPYQHMAGYVFTPHRYPRACGNDISALIHHGHAVMRYPSESDIDWMFKPPSEQVQ